MQTNRFQRCVGDLSWPSNRILDVLAISDDWHITNVQANLIISHFHWVSISRLEKCYLSFWGTSEHSNNTDKMVGLQTLKTPMPAVLKGPLFDINLLCVNFLKMMLALFLLCGYIIRVSPEFTEIIFWLSFHSNPVVIDVEHQWGRQLVS